jgi:hypothetical protein
MKKIDVLQNQLKEAEQIIKFLEQQMRGQQEIVSLWMMIAVFQCGKEIEKGMWELKLDLNSLPNSGKNVLFKVEAPQKENDPLIFKAITEKYENYEQEKAQRDEQYKAAIKEETSSIILPEEPKIQLVKG